MAEYTFNCKLCDKTFQDFVPMGTKDSECPECKNISEKVFSKPSAVTIFKGKGWTHPSPNSIR